MCSFVVVWFLAFRIGFGLLGVVGGLVSVFNFVSGVFLFWGIRFFGENCNREVGIVIGVGGRVGLEVVAEI